MGKTKNPPRFTPELWKELGITVAEWADSTFLHGVGKTGAQIYRTILKATRQEHPPLDWDYPFERLYAREDRVLWWKSADSPRRSFLPQVVVLGPREDTDEAGIVVELDPSDFHAEFPVEAGWEFYRRTSDGGVKQHLFDGENARLLEWDAERRALRFQGSSYFDYLKTNLALDAPRPPLGTLREQLAVNGRLEPLPESRLANATGINGLVFSNDGHMVYQKRRENVLVRPGELCSGFSGTVDRIDVENAVAAGGLLAALDAPREGVEELGIRRGEIRCRSFLGITRELVRGGTPEMFYAVEVDLPVGEILSRIPKDKEGIIRSLALGPYARCSVAPGDAARLPAVFDRFLQEAAAQGEGPVSIPFLTNLVLWYQRACPEHAGAAPLPPTGAG